ncbi:diguanylate cyclase [Alicyclobacillus sp. SO9]|uniref:diguanylate cyclase n=1 Tax=Alicyclobacillus sp. SO9 TaxID=2665646 RepID=UPI0018E80A10|nr:diguanylate cyclase [Alicyclobacillus sp. SO9]QQE79910.1 diguanylate cyclase [Alicyclobacillus sp. SO9]
MKSRSRSTWLTDAYSSILLIFFLWLWHSQYSPLTLGIWRSTFVLGGLALIFDAFDIVLPSGEGLTLTSALLVAEGTTLGMNSVFVTVTLIGVFNILRTPRHWKIHIFNAVQFGLSSYVGFEAFTAIGGKLSKPFNFSHPYTLVFIASYFVANILLVSMYRMLRERVSFSQSIQGFVELEVLLSYFMMMGFGVVTIVLLQHTGLAGVLFLSLVLGSLASVFRHYFSIYSHFKTLSIKDEVTNTYNHREFQTQMSGLVEQGQPFSLLLLDVDFFKTYNDTLGHPQGDRLLKTLSDKMVTFIGDKGTVFRYGGEEFAVILPNAILSGAVKLAQELCDSIADTAFIGTECMPGKHITVSTGVSSFPYMTKNRNHVIAYADEALYKAKNLGRNRVELYKSDLLSLVPELAEIEGVNVEEMQELVANLRDVDHYTYRHSERVLQYAIALASQVGIPEEDWVYFKCAALLHDIGKCQIPRYILTKPGRVNDEEWEQIKVHPVTGEEMVAQVLDNEIIHQMIRHHHERYDGRGYPDGIDGTDIPYYARLLTVVDSFDAMTSSRPYQAKRSVQEAIKELRDCAGTQFDPDLAEKFAEIVLDLKVHSLHVGA